MKNNGRVQDDNGGNLPKIPKSYLSFASEPSAVEAPAPAFPPPRRGRINRSRRGRAFQDRCAKILASWGWTVHNEKPVGRMVFASGGLRYVSSRNDVFGALDLLARKPGEIPLGVQCTLDGSVKRKLADIAAVHWSLKHERIEVWMGRASGEIAVKRFDGSALVDVGVIRRGRIYHAAPQARKAE